MNVNNNNINNNNNNNMRLPLETSYLFQRLSVAIQRGNEVSFAGTLSNFDC